MRGIRLNTYWDSVGPFPVPAISQNQERSSSAVIRVKGFATWRDALYVASPHAASIRQPRHEKKLRPCASGRLPHYYPPPPPVRFPQTKLFASRIVVTLPCGLQGRQDRCPTCFRNQENGIRLPVQSNDRIIFQEMETDCEANDIGRRS